jgi:hypothetical protein
VFLLIVAHAAALTLQVGPLVKDSFESAPLVPGGGWASLASAPQQTLALSAAAAKSGMAGIRLTDSNGSTGGGNGAALTTATQAMSASSVFARAWFRLNSSNSLGSFDIFQILSTQPGQASICDVTLNAVTSRLVIAGTAVPDVVTVTPTTGQVAADGTWHLVECGLKGIGTNAAQRLAFLDGVKIADVSNLNLTGVSANEVQLGQPYSEDRRYIGNYDLDAFESATELVASRLVLTPGSQVADTGGCVSVDASLVNSEGTLVAATVDASLSIALSNQAAAFSERNCQTPITQATLPASRSQVGFWVRSNQAGTVRIDVDSDDFVKAQAAVIFNAVPDDAGLSAEDAGGSIGADAGVDGGMAQAIDSGVKSGTDEPKADALPEVRLNVGCGCNTGVQFVLLAALLFAPFALRRKR